MEHLFLHILIIEFSIEEYNDTDLGSGGVFVFMVPELNDVYSGWETSEAWRKNCHERIINDRDVYLVLLKRLKNDFKNYYKSIHEWNKKEKENLNKRLCRSYNHKYKLWTDDKNFKIYDEIKKI